jgi:S-adenosylmethionine:tRNA ribosyltransferase-isomerase
MKTDLFDFHLPEQLIAQEPLPERDAARLLVLDRGTKTFRDSAIRELPSLLQPGDLLVFNDTRVIPARLRAVRDSSGGRVEFLLVPIGMQQTHEQHTVRRVLTKSGGTLKPDETFTLAEKLKATMVERQREAGDLVRFHCSESDFAQFIARNGEVPLPPYIRREPGPSSEADRQRYQTIFAQAPGAVAAPTAGLHFTDRLLEALKTRGVGFAYVTLHVGPGTFKPVKSDEVENHFVDPEPYFVPPETVTALAAAKREHRRVIAVGTTSLRALESIPDFTAGAGSQSIAGETKLFVYPPYNFRTVDALLTNFHVPKSSLLMLAAAFSAPGSTDGVDFVKRAYEHAVASGYRFYSYGDASLIL